jgi:hypothetical protein
MHQHPLRIFGSLNARQHGVGALGAAINNGNLRMICQRQLRETASPGLMAMTTRVTRGCASSAATECSRIVLSPIERYCLGHSVCMRRPKPAAGTTAHTSEKVTAMS